MPNTGRPSQDCHLCRARRVKCDLGRPSCTRCIKYGKTCPGYRQPLDLVFQNEDLSSLETSRGKPGRHKNAKASPHSVLVQAAAAGAASQLLADATLLPEKLHDHAVSLILKSYSTVNCLPSAKSDLAASFGYHDFLPEILQQNQNGDGCIQLVAEAFAYAYTKNHANASLDHEFKTSGHYGRALSAVNASLRNPQTRLDDASLVAVWLLGNYEVLTASPIGVFPPGLATYKSWGRAPERWYIHARGLASMLRARGVERLRTRSQRNLFWVALSIVQICSILAQEPLDRDAKLWLDSMESSLQPFDKLPFLVARYTYIITEFVPRVTRVLVSSEGGGKVDLDTVFALAKEASDFDDITNALEKLPEDTQLNLLFRSIHRMAKIGLHQTIILLITLAVPADDDEAAAPVEVDEEEKILFLRAYRATSIRKIRETGDQVLSSGSLLFRAFDQRQPSTFGSPGVETTTPPKSPSYAPVCWADSIRIIPVVTMVALYRTMSWSQRCRAAEMLRDIGMRFRVRQAMVRDFSMHLLPEWARWKEEVRREVGGDGL